MRESFVFYQSFLAAIEELEPEAKLKVYDAIAHYAIFDSEPKLKGVEKAIFYLIKPQIDANNKKYENGKKGAKYGKKGGRPKKENPEETPKKPQENPQKTPNVNDNVNVNVNDNVNVNVNDNEEEEKVIELEKKKFLNNCYGDLKNVYLSKENYETLKSYTYNTLNDFKELDNAINELSEKIVTNRDKYKPYEEDNPDAHFVWVQKFLKQKYKRLYEDKGINENEKPSKYNFGF